MDNTNEWHEYLGYKWKLAKNVIHIHGDDTFLLVQIPPEHVFFHDNKGHRSGVYRNGVLVQLWIDPDLPANCGAWNLYAIYTKEWEEAAKERIRALVQMEYAYER